MQTGSEAHRGVKLTSDLQPVLRLMHALSPPLPGTYSGTVIKLYYYY
jgi:hypothetical protein